jgi:tetratricopeptide (TPR) repeat protein
MLASLSVLYGILGDAEAVEAAHGEADAIRQELGQRPHRFRYAFAQYALGNLEAAIVATRNEVAELERAGETGQRSTMLSLQGWVLALTGDNEAAIDVAEEGRRIGSADDAVTQMLWHAAAGLAHAQLGNLEPADRLTAEAVEVARTTDSVSAADAWEARARVLSMLGRRDEMLEAAARARELHVAKGSVNFIRRVDEFLAGAGVAAEASPAR